VAFAELSGVRLFFTDEGAGDPPMLFVHGLSCDSNDWIWQLPHFTAAHRVLAVDLRGHGHSSAPTSGYDPVTLAADLAELLRDRACAPVVAVGHSLGGLVVSVLAADHPDLVCAVVAVDPAYLVVAETLERVAQLLGALESGDPVSLVQAMVAGADPSTTPAHLRCWQRRRVAAVPPHVLRQTVAGMSSGTDSVTSGASGEALLRRRQCPVLSIFTDPRRSAAERPLFADPRSESVTWEAAEHWLHQQHPAELNALVDRWLAGAYAVGR